MDKKQMTIIGVVAAVIVLYFILKQKGTTTAQTNQTARSASLTEPITGLIGSGITLLSNFVKSGVDYFSGNQASQSSSGVPAVNATAYQTTDIYSPYYSGAVDITTPDMAGYFDSQGIGLPM